MILNPMPGVQQAFLHGARSLNEASLVVEAKKLPKVSGCQGALWFSSMSPGDETEMLHHLASVLPALRRQWSHLSGVLTWLDADGPCSKQVFSPSSSRAAWSAEEDEPVPVLKDILWKLLFSPLSSF